jgi:magnesium chelatase family protein
MIICITTHFFSIFLLLIYFLILNAYFFFMLSKLYTVALVGLDCKIVEVEVDYKKGQTYFSIVGLADKSIQEAKDRIPSAIRNTGAEYIPVRIIMNLAPAELTKSGPHYDLPLAIGYLIASDQLNFDPRDKLFLGELALDGRLRPVHGILPIVDAVKRKGFKEVYLPSENANEASLVQGIDIYALDNLKQLVDHFQGIRELTPFVPDNNESFFENEVKFDLEQVKGQETAKRALEIAASGGHNILMSGVPGSGKTMLSRCLPGILPEMTIEESLEVTRVHSVAGLTSNKNPLVRSRPFRTPHHTSSQVALVGGGAVPRPGEISLAHRGILFLDEFPEFSSQSLEALRQPLEDKVVTISRASGTLTFPANFILIAAMNPCKCGYRGDPIKQCTCTSIEVQRYQKRISGPILDRIDLLMSVAKVEHDKLFANTKAESSEIVRARVQKARNIQLERFKGQNIFSNSEMSQKDIEKYIQVDASTKTLLTLAVQRMNLSARSYFRILKVSRTIADLDGCEKVSQDHVAEALSYRVELN